MRKALKIIKKLEEASSNNKSILEISQRGERIIYSNRGSHFFIPIFYLALIIAPWIVVYFDKNETHLVYIIIVITYSIIMLLSYLKGSFQTNNNIEIDLAKKEITISRRGILAKKILKHQVIKTHKSNELLKENIPLSDSLEARITLKNNGQKIPLFDLRNDTDFDQIFLSLKLLVKGE